MNEQIQQHLNEILEMIKSGINFASDQAPIFIQEILTYYTWYHSTLLILFTAILAVNVWYIVYLVKQTHDIMDQTMALLIPLLSFLLFGLLVVHNFVELLKITLAPRLYLIETISNLF